MSKVDHARHIALRLKRSAPFCLMCVALFFLAPVKSIAENDKPMGFSFFTPCSGNGSVCNPIILADGLIERNTPQKFASFISREVPNADKLWSGLRICFNSQGGDLMASLELGRIIRRLALDTCLRPTYERIITVWKDETFVKDVVCASACAFAFLGGVNRSIEPGSRYGIHQFYGQKGNLGDGITQVTIVLLATYIEQMGADRVLLDAASVVPSKHIYWLPIDDLRRLSVDNTTATISRWQLSPLPDGAVVASTHQVTHGYRNNISLILLKESGGLSLSIAFVPNERFPDLAPALSTLNADRTDIYLDVDEEQLAHYERPTWSVRSGGLTTLLRLPPKAHKAFHSGKILHLRVLVPHVLEMYDPSMEFSLDGLNSLLNAVLR